MDPWELTGRAADVASAHLGIVLGVLGVLGAAWLLAGIGLRGSRLLAWCVPPVLGAASLVLVAGPGRLFAKRYEGPTLLGIAPGHSVTALDVPAGVAGGAAVLVAALLVSRRLGLRDRRGNTGGAHAGPAPVDPVGPDGEVAPLCPDRQ